MNKIVCFYWEGERWQETTGGPLPSDISFVRHLNRVGPVSKELVTKYINNLYQGVKKFTTVPFEFICFTNEFLPGLSSEIKTKHFFKVTNKGVLPRMYMFSRDAGLTGSQVLSLDLDIIITGSLDDLLKYNGPFCTRMSWTRGEENLIDGDIMSFRANDTMEELFWKPLAAAPHLIEASTGGRERLWVRHVMKGLPVDTWQDIAPGQVCSYKFHVRESGKVPDNTRIVSCHGYPRPHQIEEEWRMDFWK